MRVANDNNEDDDDGGDGGGYRRMVGNITADRSRRWFFGGWMGLERKYIYIYLYSIVRSTSATKLGVIKIFVATASINAGKILRACRIKSGLNFPSNFLRDATRRDKRHVTRACFSLEKKKTALRVWRGKKKEKFERATTRAKSRPNQRVNDPVIELYISSMHSITLRCAGARWYYFESSWIMDSAY